MYSPDGCGRRGGGTPGDKLQSASSDGFMYATLLTVHGGRGGYMWKQSVVVVTSVGQKRG